MMRLKGQIQQSAQIVELQSFLIMYAEHAVFIVVVRFFQSLYQKIPNKQPKQSFLKC